MDIAKDLIGRIEGGNSSVLIIGDTTHDYEVAQTFGIGCLLVCGGHHGRDKLKQCGASVFDSLSEIYDAVVVPA